MVIREAEASDVDALSELAKQTYSDAFGHSMRASDLAAHLEQNLSPARIRAMLDKDVFLLAEKADKIIGFVQFGDVHISGQSISEPTIRPGDKEIRRLYVLADFQDRGIGTRLMNAALNDPRLNATANIYLDVWEDNHGAQRFYKRYGFEKVGERRFHVASGEATGVDFIMVRRSPVDG